MIRAVRAIARVSSRERGHVLRAFISIGLIDVALRVRGFNWVLRHARSVSTDMSVRCSDLERAEAYASAIRRVARRFPVRAECLHRALTLHHWLRNDGLPSELRVGVMLDDAELKAHAWIELGGSLIGDSPAEVAPFAPLQSRPQGRIDRFAWSRP